MTCKISEICGGCSLRGQTTEDYQKDKENKFKRLIEGLNQPSISFGTPVFIADGKRRRAVFAFKQSKGKVTLGFNQNKSSEIVDVEACALLTPKINKNIEAVKDIVSELCQVKITNKKGKKITYSNVYKGDVSVTEVFNGLDVVLEFEDNLALDHRMVIFELSQKYADIIRISYRKTAFDEAETIVEKIKPYIKIADYEVYIPAGTFLQPSDEGEKALVNLVTKYIGEDSGKIADLFCGVGTFSYPLSRNPKNQITSIDSSKSLLEGFKQSINKNMITNIQIETKNLFKYPLDENELKGFKVIVFDPPRAGAFEQVRKFALMKDEDKPHKIVAISCNPNSFIKDANVLINAGYFIKEITLVDQFVYSNHSELVALFELK